MLAKGLKPRIIISENGAQWAIRSESTLKTVNVEFTPGVEFDETTPDGREVKVNSRIYSIQQSFSFVHFPVNH